MSSTEDATALEMVRLGYGGGPADDDTGIGGRCLHFRARFSSPEAAILAIEEIDSYNGFNQERVIPALQKLTEALEGHGVTLKVWVGREYSPVLYIDGLLWDKTDQQRALEILAEAGPDELDLRGTVIRAWWD